MYGLLAGCQCALDGAARRVWRRHLCGLCESLSRSFGPQARLLATPDAALLSLLVEAQTPAAEGSPSPSRCLFRRPFHLPVVSTRSPGSRFARSIAIAAAAARLEDAVRDGDVTPRWVARLGALIIRPAARRARHDLTDVGFDPAMLTEAQREAALTEQASGDFDALAAPTERAYATVFGHTAALAGAHGGVAVVRDVGRWFGRLAYVADARADYAQDVAHERFNALAACFGTAALPQGAALADAAMERLREALGRLRLLRHREVAEQLFSRGLSRKIAWACGESEGGKRIRREKPKAPERPAGRPRWRGWGCSGGWSEEEETQTVTCCCCGDACAHCCLVAPCACCS